MRTVPTVTTMRYLVTHTMNNVKEPRANTLTTTLITSSAKWQLIARNLQKMLLVNYQEDGYKAIEIRETFYDEFPDDPDDGGRR